MEQGMSYGAWAVIIVLGFPVTAALGLVFQWVDRVATARIQWRKGPPFYQPFADVAKLLGKETLVSHGASMGVFLAAPLVGFTGTAVAASLLWAAAIYPELSFAGDLIAVIYFLVVPSLALILGGSASGSPHSGLGSSREMKLVLGYELPFILAMVPAILNAGGTFRLGNLISAQADGSLLLGVPGVLAFLCALLAGHAKLGLVPFDQAEAETELMGGVELEYSGPALAMIRLMRAMLLFTLPMLIITVFWGGLQFTGLGGLSTIVKFIVLLVVVVLIRNTSPRLRIDQAVRFFWFILAPVAIIACAWALVFNYYG